MNTSISVMCLRTLVSRTAQPTQGQHKCMESEHDVMNTLMERLVQPVRPDGLGEQNQGPANPPQEYEVVNVPHNGPGI